MEKMNFPMVKVAFDEKNILPPVVQITTAEFAAGLETKDKLDALYKAIGCQMVEVVDLEVGGQQYVIFCDEEGKLDRWVPTLPIYHDCKCYDIIANSFVVAKEDEDENFVSMTDKEFEEVMAYLQEYVPKALTEVKKIYEMRV